MTQPRCRAIFVSVALLLLTMPLVAQEKPPGWPPIGTGSGELFPDLAFPRLADGELTRLSAYRGKKVLLIQFASW